MSIDILMQNACWKVNSITMIAEWNGIVGALTVGQRRRRCGCGNDHDHGCFDSSFDLRYLWYGMFWQESFAKNKAIIIPTYVESILNILFTVIFSHIYSRFGLDYFQIPL
jgi:hypothetical protein